MDKQQLFSMAQADAITILRQQRDELLAMVKNYRAEAAAQGADDSDLTEIDALINRAEGVSA